MKPRPFMRASQLAPTSSSRNSQTCPVIPASIAGVTRSERVDAAEIVIREVQRDRGVQVLPLLRISVGQSRQALAPLAQ